MYMYTDGIRMRLISEVINRNILTRATIEIEPK